MEDVVKMEEMDFQELMAKMQINSQSFQEILVAISNPNPMNIKIKRVMRLLPML